LNNLTLYRENLPDMREIEEIIAHATAPDATRLNPTMIGRRHIINASEPQPHSRATRWIGGRLRLHPQAQQHQWRCPVAANEAEKYHAIGSSVVGVPALMV
jgi:hypothetical protein